MFVIHGNSNAAILRSVLARLGERGRTCLVVPDRFSLEAESALLDAIPTGATVNAEVTTFARLADKLCGAGVKKLSEEGAVMAIASILEAEKKELRVLHSDSSGSAAKEIYRTIEQLAASDVEPSDLNREFGEATLTRKAKDLAIVYGAFRAFLEGGVSDASARLMRATQAIATAEWVRDTRFLIVGYDAMTKANRRFVRELDRYADSVFVGAVRASFAFGSPAVYEQFAEESALPEREGEVLAEWTPFRRLLWETADDLGAPSIDASAILTPAERIRILAANNRYEAAERVAREIKDEVFSGARYSDFAVVVSDIGEAAEEFFDYGIPVNADKPYAAESDPLIRLLLAATECAITGFRTLAVRKAASNPLLGVPETDFYDWDNYVTRFGLDRSRHLSPYEIVPKDDRGEAQIALFEAAERTRKRTAEAIAPFAKTLNAAKTVSECVRLCKDWTERFRSASESVRATMSPADADFCSEAENRLGEILDNLGYAENAGVTPEMFFRILRSGIRASQIRIAPTYADAVNVFTPDSFGFREYRRIFWLGADEGILPAVQTDCGLLGDADLDRMASVGAAVEPKIAEINDRARFRLFATLFLSPELTAITWTEKPNFFVRLLRDRFSIPVEAADETIGLDGGAEEARIARRAAGCSVSATRVFYRRYAAAAARGEPELGSALSVLGNVAGCILPRSESAPIGRARELFFGSGKTSVSQLEKYFSCPYRHFVEYGLKCRERKTAEVRANEIGNFLHAVAERYVRAGGGDPETVGGRIADRLIEETDAFRADGAAVVAVRKRLRKESVLLCRRLDDFGRRSSFEPYRVEAEFGKDLPPLRVNGIDLCGRIDRIDRKDDEAVVIDYKTGKTNFTLTDVYFGAQIQLFVYMRILSRSGFRPAAALFFPVTGDFGSPAPVTGWVNETSVSDLDRTFGFERPTSEFLPVSLNRTSAKSGVWKLNRADAAFSDRDWNVWLDYTETLVSQAVGEIEAGYVASRPLCTGGTLPCSYCKARGACEAFPKARLHREKATKETLAGETDHGEV